jgi:glucose/arabinose dehydrogenase
MRLAPPTYAQVISFILALTTLGGPAVQAATLPGGFTEALVASGLSSPTAMQFAPDGRLFVCEQGGRLRVIKNGQLLSTPFLTVTVSSVGERGLLGVAFDPNFAVNQFVYVYYTATSPTIHNRVSRFTANGDVAVAGSETILLELENLNATNHNGGALAFGADGKLYVAVGENAVGSNAQSMNNLLGKMLRINPNGSIPTDNPFYNTATGRNRAIWALGLRNPFTFAFNPTGSGMFINDVGQGAWEEVNDGVPGANYGWPETEGMTTDPRFDSPRYAYGHTGGVCAITGGAFYSPQTAQYPADYNGDYFFADYCAGWIRKMESATGTGVVTFATGLPSPVDLKVSDDGSLYYLARGSGGNGGVVYRIQYGASAPTITSHPASRTVAPGASVTFGVRASGAGTLRYQWQRNGTNIAGATSQDYTLASAALADNGARFRAVVANDFGSVTSSEAVLTVTANQGPTAVIAQPSAGTLYSGGSVINYSGTGTDPEDGTLGGSAFTWQVDFHHDTHSHPFIASTSGAQSGSFTIPTTGETSANVWYRIYLTVRDSAGLTHTVQRDIRPRTVSLTLATSPAGLQLRLDDQPVSTPTTFASVVGIVRNIAAAATQSSGSTTYEFVSWSDGGAATHNVSTPASNATYTATYRPVTGGTGTGLSATYFDALNFSGATVTRTDPTVDFNWGSGAPAPGIAADTFSVRWTGQVEPQFTGTYTFYTVSDDGVRLWVNGQPLVNRWTNHAAIEDSGTIALSAGQRYDIRMEFYENGGLATARLLWSSASVPKAVIPSARLYPQASSPPPAAPVRISFQPASAPAATGYLPDVGLVFGSRGNGHTYGWNTDNALQTRDRNSPSSPDQAYDTLTHMQKPENPNAAWEIAVANGSYSVRIVAGDALYIDSVFRIAVEGVLTVSGTPTTGTRWIEGTSTVSVTDGRLTITSAAGAANNKICLVVITPR